jgi:hypothetical protein
MTSHRTPAIDSVNAVTRHRVLIGFVAVVGAFAAQAATPLTMKLEMEAHKGYFAERCFKLESGQKLAYQLSTSHPIEFNLHHHPADGSTVIPDQLTVKSQHSKQIVAESGGEYCFMATNVDKQPAPYDVVINYQISAN